MVGSQQHVTPYRCRALSVLRLRSEVLCWGGGAGSCVHADASPLHSNPYYPLPLPVFQGCCLGTFFQQGKYIRTRELEAVFTLMLHCPALPLPPYLCTFLPIAAVQAQLPARKEVCREGGASRELGAALKQLPAPWL